MVESLKKTLQKLSEKSKEVSIDLVVFLKERPIYRIEEKKEWREKMEDKERPL